MTPDPPDIHFTIISVLYHSEKWLAKYLGSIVDSDYDLSRVDLILVDNARESGDHAALAKYRKDLDRLNRYQYMDLDRNRGFGIANNIGSGLARTEYLFFLNIDTELDKGCLKTLSEAIRQDSGHTGVWECRQFPYEHPKYYDPVNLESSWSSGACMVTPQTAFSAVGGFDPRIHMYCEDVELSWKLRLHGYRCRYVPKAVVYHYAYAHPGEVKPVQQYNSLKNAMYLRFRYGRFPDLLKGFLMLFIELTRGRFGRKNVLWILLQCPLLMLFAVRFRYDHRQLLGQTRFQFHGTDYALHRKGAFHTHKRHRPAGPLVSIIIRTVDRPDALREALQSVVNQTYAHIEILVVEDGPGDERNRAVIREFSGHSIRFLPTGEKVGRCRAGNFGLENAAGDFINFLDDDDLFFADHIETLVAAAVEAGADAAYSLSFVTPQIIVEKPYRYEITGILHGIAATYNPHALMYYNQFPIQSVLFARRLYTELGGFDENLKYLEDWDLWLRYARKWNLVRVEKTTTLFRIPGVVEEANRRALELERYHETLYQKYAESRFELTGRQLVQMAQSIFETFPLKKMQHEMDNIDVMLQKNSLYFSGGNADFAGGLKLAMAKFFGRMSRFKQRKRAG